MFYDRQLPDKALLFNEWCYYRINLVGTPGTATFKRFDIPDGLRIVDLVEHSLEYYIVLSNSDVIVVHYQPNHYDGNLWQQLSYVKALDIDVTKPLFQNYSNTKKSLVLDFTFS